MKALPISDFINTWVAPIRYFLRGGAQILICSPNQSPSFHSPPLAGVNKSFLMNEWINQWINKCPTQERNDENQRTDKILETWEDSAWLEEKSLNVYIPPIFSWNKSINDRDSHILERVLI